MRPDKNHKWWMVSLNTRDNILVDVGQPMHCVTTFVIFRMNQVKMWTISHSKNTSNKDIFQYCYGG